MSLFDIVLHAVHVMFTCYARVVRQNRFKPVETGSNRFKPGKTQEKSAPSAVATGYINRAATATRRDAVTVAVHQVLQVSNIYYLCLYEC